VNPARQIGRVPDPVWKKLKAAAKKSGMTFTQWALTNLIAAAEGKAVKTEDEWLTLSGPPKNGEPRCGWAHIGEGSRTKDKPIWVSWMPRWDSWGYLSYEVIFPLEDRKIRWVNSPDGRCPPGSDS
jgi:hypothetical protein